MTTTSLSTRALLLSLTTLLPALAHAQSYECESSFGTSCAAVIPDGISDWRGQFRVGELESSLFVLPGACDPADRITDVDVGVHILHRFVGDLSLELTHPDGTSVDLLFRPGIGSSDETCTHDDLDVTLDDDDGVAGFDLCERNIPALSGTLLPFNPLSIFDGKPRNGTWTLSVRDHATGELGVLRGWTLHLPCAVDLPDVQLDATDGLLAERGPNDSATVTVTRGGDTSGALLVRYVVTGTASLADFGELSGELTVPAGSASADIEISAIDDDLEEIDETIVLTLVPTDEYEVGPRGSATVTLVEESLDEGGEPDAGDPEDPVADAGPEVPGVDAGGGTAPDEGCGCSAAVVSRSGLGLAGSGGSAAFLLLLFAFGRRRGRRRQRG